METKSRKDSEDMQLNSLWENIARLEKTLGSESKRRVEAHKALQGMFEAQMATVQDKLEVGLMHRIDGLRSLLSNLNDRVDTAERDFKQARTQYVRDIEDKSAMVAKDAENLQAMFQGERHDRKERETLIVAKLRELEGRSAESLETSQAAMDARLAELREDLGMAVKDDSDKRFQDYILEEMAALKRGLVVETQARESADDEIVNALHHYTAAVQDALRAVNQA